MPKKTVHVKASKTGRKAHERTIETSGEKAPTPKEKIQKVDTVSHDTSAPAKTDIENKFQAYRRRLLPETSPWGEVQHAVWLSEGIAEVHTASHGGILLDEERNNMVHPAWRHEDGWYEEDCDWAIVALTHQQDSTNKEYLEQAEKVAKEYYPDEYETVFPNKYVMPNESSKRLETMYLEVHRADPIVYSAESRDDGFVKVTTYIGSAEPQSGSPKQTWLLSKNEYQRVNNEATNFAVSYVGHDVFLPAVLNPRIHTQHVEGSPKEVFEGVGNMYNFSKIQFLKEDGTVDGEGVIREMPLVYSNRDSRRVTMTSSGWGGSELFVDEDVISKRGWVAVRSIPEEQE